MIEKWLLSLASRGIATRLVAGRVRHFPASAYKQLTGDDVVFLRTHRQEIKAFISQRPVEATLDAAFPVGGAETPTYEPTPRPPCPYCMRECVGPSHHAYAALHRTDPAKQQPDPTPPATTERETSEAALRHRLGWDEKTLTIWR